MRAFTLSDMMDHLMHQHAKQGHANLSQLRVLALSLGVLSWACPVITIAGTNGKGSCAALLSACYVAAGYRVGCFTSPHLERVNERIAINHVPVSDAEFLAALRVVDATANGLVMSFFAHMTLAALLIFQSRSLDVLILEVGCGGRLDPVNLVDPTVAVITSIGLDHTHILGDTLEEIASEKAGVMRPGIDVIYGGDVAVGVLEAKARRHKANWFHINRAFSIERDQQQDHWSNVFGESVVIPATRFFKNNVACVLQTMTCLQSRLPISLLHQQQGIGQASLPGRFEAHQYQGVSVILDVAHNADSAALLAQQLHQNEPSMDFCALFSAQATKSLVDIVAPLTSIVSHWVVAPLDDLNSAAVEDLEAACQYHRQSNEKAIDVESAFVRAITTAREHGTMAVVVFGSFITVARVKQMLKRSNMHHT